MKGQRDPVENNNKKGGSRLEKYNIKKYERKPRFTTQQKILMAVAVVLAIALVAVAAWKSLFVRPDLDKKNPVANTPSASTSTELPEEIDYGSGVRPKADGERKSKDFYTVLILGRDTGGGGNTDTMLLASYDVTNQKAAVMSIPRDTMVNVSWDVKKINSVYNMNGGGDRGLNALYKEVSQLVGFEPDFRVIVEWEAVGQLVDAIGGVYFDVPYNMDYHDPYQDLVIEQEKGYRLLNGEDAMQVIRWRKNDASSPYGNVQVGDDGRIGIQQDFLKAVIKQMMTPSNVKNIGKIAQVFEDCVDTDMSFQNILWFGQQAFAGGLNLENVSFFTMPYRIASAWSRSYEMNLSYVVPLSNELLNAVNEKLSPFKEVFALSDLDIMYTNRDGSVGSTSGHLEDAKAGLPPEKPKKEEPEPDEETPGSSIVIDPETGEVSGEGSEGVTYDPVTGILTVPGLGEVQVDPETGEIIMPETGGEPGEEEPSGEAEDPVEGETPGEEEAPAEGEAEPSGETEPVQSGAEEPAPSEEEPAEPSQPTEPEAPLELETQENVTE
ncbi:MAG: LCP family protein [Oscillibacter sp.]|nr:LCP family protein [Oscillibacter sp.]